MPSSYDIKKLKILIWKKLGYKIVEEADYSPNYSGYCSRPRKSIHICLSYKNGYPVEDDRIFRVLLHEAGHGMDLNSSDGRSAYVFGLEQRRSKYEKVRRNGERLITENYPKIVASEERAWDNGLKFAQENGFYVDQYSWDKHRNLSIESYRKQREGLTVNLCSDSDDADMIKSIDPVLDYADWLSLTISDALSNTMKTLSLWGETR